MDDAQYNWQPPGTANTPAKSHVHICSAIDFFIAVTMMGKPSSYGELASAAGLPDSPQDIWKHQAAIPFAPVDDYGKKMQKIALDFVGGLTDKDLDNVHETRFFGKQTTAQLLQLVGNHSAGHGGDIASVKGMQGLKGLPF
jgi:hypothetical protein